MNLEDTILPHVAPAMLVMFRLSGLMIFGPLFSAVVVPVRVRVFLTLLLGLASYPLLAAGPLAGVDVPLSVASIAPLAAMEIALGAIIGFLAGLPLVASQLAGVIAGQQMGLGFATFYNPSIDDESDVVAQFLYLLTMGGFLIVGGHEELLRGTLHSFSHVPLGGFRIEEDALALLGGLLVASLELALRVAAPLLALVFLETIAMGFLSKTVPQLNILSLGFPVRILAGLFIVAVGLYVIDAVLLEGVDDMLTSLFNWIESHPQPLEPVTRG